MSLPPGFLDELRTRTSIAQVVGRKVVWDQRKSNQGKGDWWAPCPFHQEKSASFHVDDRKGYYYCFGCQAKGDALGFVKETENVSFMEAVEILAKEAGMQMPARDPRAQQKADRRTVLSDVMDQAIRHYRLQLTTGAAAEAREYLSRRGLSPAAQERWEIGFAPDTRQGIFGQMTGKGVPAQDVIDAGLAAESDRGGAPYDRFRGRIIFPIRDARGRGIALGGRAMAADARAKYLNSPETELFDKGRSLYNHGPAREAAGKGQPLIVAEGYMDVIALSEAGFTATVAPLGTAITENQLQMMWRIAAEPIIALDGDTAGLRAAMRLIDMALPLVEAGKSLRFALMPEGQDPDDLIKASGPGAMQARLDAAIPIVDLLWRRETEGKVFDSPERKAALDKVLREKLRLIQDPNLRAHYGQEIKDKRWSLFNANRSKGGKRRWQPKDQPVPVDATRASNLVTATPETEDALREAVILATLCQNPGHVPLIQDRLDRLSWSRPDHSRIAFALLQNGHAPDGALDTLLQRPHVAIAPPVRHAHNDEIAVEGLLNTLAQIEARRAHLDEVRDAEEDMTANVDEGLTWRLRQSAQERDKATRGSTEDKAQYATAANGAKLDKEERSAFDTLLGSISFDKPKR